MHPCLRQGEFLEPPAPTGIMVSLRPPRALWYAAGAAPLSCLRIHDRPIGTAQGLVFVWDVAPPALYTAVMLFDCNENTMYYAVAPWVVGGSSAMAANGHMAEICTCLFLSMICH